MLDVFPKLSTIVWLLSLLFVTSTIVVIIITIQEKIFK